MLSRFRNSLRIGGCCLALVLGSGCDLLRRGETDERREANFQAGYNQALQGLNDDAIRSYQRALDSNPRSALAHRELGFLLRDKKHDYVTAVYHLRRCQEILASRNDRDAKDPTIDDAIRQAQLQLAIEFSSQIGQQQTQSRTDELKRRNAELEATVQRLTQQLAANASAQAAFANSPGILKPLPTNTAVQPSAPIQNLASNPGANSNPNPSSNSGESARQPIRSAPLQLGGSSSGSKGQTGASSGKHGTTASPSGGSTGTSSNASKGPKTHTIRSGETPASIARAHGITPQQLMSANRGIDAKRLRVGQTLNLPDNAK